MGMLGRATTVAGAVRSSRGRHPLGQRIAAVLPMLRDAFTGRWADAPRGRLLAGLAGLVYVISPLDILPELLLGPFGLGTTWRSPPWRSPPCSRRPRTGSTAEPRERATSSRASSSSATDGTAEPVRRSLGSAC